MGPLCVILYSDIHVIIHSIHSHIRTYWQAIRFLSCVTMVLVTKRNKNRGLSASVIRSFPRNRQRVFTELSMGVRGIIKGCLRIVKGHRHSHNGQKHPRNRTVFLE